MNCGSGPAGGFELLPGRVVNGPLHGSPAAGYSAKPLNEAGALPLSTSSTFHHCAPQNVTDAPRTALPSPITNAPLEGKAAVPSSAPAGAASTAQIASAASGSATRSSPLVTNLLSVGRIPEDRNRPPGLDEGVQNEGSANLAPMLSDGDPAPDFTLDSDAEDRKSVV